MFELIRTHQLNLMLILCGACGILVFLLFNTRFLSRSRKIILILMELSALFLLWFDRSAYIYAGDPGHTGYVMVRLSNFMVFFLTSGIVFCFNLYLTDLLTGEGQLKVQPKRLFVAGAMSLMGMVMSVIAAFTNLYYYFDETNLYHRGDGFLLAYVIPVLCPLIQFTVIFNYRKFFSKLIYTSLILYIFVPIFCGILQIFTYGISIVNMSMVAVSISLYIFMYLDMNNTVEHAHRIEIKNMQGEKQHMEKLFDQLAGAFVSAFEKKDEYSTGNSVRTAEYAKKLAQNAGKSEEDCQKAYYAGLLHDVGIMGIPDMVIKNQANPDSFDKEVMKQKPALGNEILSGITEFPYLAEGAHYSHERYNGTGYPEGLKGDEIPEIARLVAVADAYVSMTSKKRYRDELPSFIAREKFVKGAGEEFDPFYADLMVKIIDSQVNEAPSDDRRKIESTITCKEYRQETTSGIEATPEIKKISFDCEPLSEDTELGFAPSVILFDSYDGTAHFDEKSIAGYHYLEYGEVWFDDHNVITAANNIVENPVDDRTAAGRYEIIAGRVDDHLRLVMKSPVFAKEVIMALPSLSKAAYIGITGENCRITNIEVEPTGDVIQSGDIPRIADPVSFIDHLESDIKNVQIDRWMSASTPGVEVNGKMSLKFHTQTLPEAELIWHVPYIVLYYSDDGQLMGPGYREYNMIKLNGEDQGDKEFAKNKFIMKKTPDFPGWDKWREINKEGLECEVNLERKGDRIILKTKNLGISLECLTTVLGDKSQVYVSLSGDQVALTDIRVD
ncbi:MAG: HD domain-containing protein [Lachnospiraceae bacterium]|nr:HD domain-containing protein [Lachnospiraceae bacterium]